MSITIPGSRTLAALTGGGRVNTGEGQLPWPAGGCAPGRGPAPRGTAKAAGPTEYEHIDVHKVGVNLGAEVAGVRLARDPAPEVVAELRSALLSHRVVFLRGQDHADATDQREFGARLGTLTKPHPAVGVDGEAALPIDSDRSPANSRHTDVTLPNRTTSISILRAVTLPSHGCVSVWADTVRAYQTLPTGLRALADGLRAVRSNAYDNLHGDDEQRFGGTDLTERACEVVEPLEVGTAHPVVRVHPATGERTLELGHFVRRLGGLSTADSNDLLELFHRHLTRLENTVRWTWRPGDVAIWDNHSTRLYAEHRQRLVASRWAVRAD